MKSFKPIHTSYLATDGFLAQSELNATSQRAKARWARLRHYNDQAYYVMLFAQLEQFIDAECTRLIDRKKGSLVWKNRRLWDSTDADRMQFMRKVALLTEKGAATYNKKVPPLTTRSTSIMTCDVILPTGRFWRPARLLFRSRFRTSGNLPKT